MRSFNFFSSFNFISSHLNLTKEEKEEEEVEEEKRLTGFYFEWLKLFKQTLSHFDGVELFIKGMQPECNLFISLIKIP